jgi:ABC-type sugar transport system ATPase subunit
MRDVVQVATRVVILKGGRKVQDRSMASLQAEDLRRMIFEAA